MPHDLYLSSPRHFSSHEDEVRLILAPPPSAILHMILYGISHPFRLTGAYIAIAPMQYRSNSMTKHRRLFSQQTYVVSPVGTLIVSANPRYLVRYFILSP
ncbi:hypothetical protein BGW80DRAFT_1362401 [Lactifluus volemus]|nr:hypothetical protein BGW80DRAFT_1362401 [Lactifluus volemus]